MSTASATGFEFLSQTKIDEAHSKQKSYFLSLDILRGIEKNFFRWRGGGSANPVSYTHLTLPTIYSV